MATAQRHAFAVAGLAGEVWTASLHDARPAVIVGRGGPERDWPDVVPLVAERLARAGFTVAAFAYRARAADAGTHVADLAAVCAALKGGDLVAGLRAPRALVVFGYGSTARVARAHAAGEPAVSLVTWTRPAGGPGRGEEVVVGEMIAAGSHVTERSSQLDEALDELLAWLARVL